jgi:autotransporter-associated beta strand protein
LSPGSATFNAPAGTVIDTSAGDGIDGDNTQNWVLTNSGAITGASAGVNLSSAALNGVTLDNFSIIRGNTSYGVLLSNGGHLTNHAGATIAGALDGVQINGAGSTFVNDGSITSASNSSAGVSFGAGGTFTQSATGTVGTNGGTGYGLIFNGGTLAGTNAGTIYGASSLIAFQASAGSTGTFSNSGTLSGGTGALLAGSSVTLTNTGIITGTSGTAVSLTGSNDTLILGTGSVLNGSAASTGVNNVLTLQGSGSAANTFSGFNNLLMSGTAWTLSGPVTTTSAAATATNVQSGTLTVAGALSNGGGGGITIASGATLQIGNGGATGSWTGNIVDNGTLILNRSGTSVPNAAVVSGTGALVQQGSGTQILTGASTYTGGTIVNAGTLQLGNSPTTNYGGIGRIVGTVTVNPGATLLLNGTNVLGFDLATTSVQNINLNGGTLTHTGSGDNGWGVTYNLTGATMQATGTGQFAFGGFAGGNGTIVNTLASPTSSVIAGKIFLREFNPGNVVSFNVADGAAASDLLVSANMSPLVGSDAATRGIVKLGTGNMTLTGTNIYTGVTTISAGTLQLGNGGTTGSITSNVTDNASLVFNRSDVATFGNTVSGTGTLTQAGTGTITLAGVNTYTGGTFLNAGILSVGADTGLGAAAGGLTFNGGTLQFTSALATARAVTLNSTGTIDTQANADTLSGVISGAGALTKQGTGTLTLTGNNTYAGATTISAGTLQIGSGGTTGSIVGNVVDNGTLIFNRADAITYAGVVGGTGALTKLGANTLTLTGNSTYAGTTTISAGTLQLGNGGTTGSVTGNIANNGALAFNRSDALVYGSVVSGAGSLTLAGTGNMTLTGANTYTGGTTIASGTLQLGNGGTTGGIVGDVTDNGVLAFNRSDAFVFGGIVSGTGSLAQAGTGTTTLTGTNTYSGGTFLNAGILSVGADSSLGAATGGLTFNGGTLQFTGALATARAVTLNSTGTIDTQANADTLSGVIAGAGALTKQGTGTLTLTGNDTYTGGTTIGAGTLQIGNGGTSGSIIGDVTDNGTLVFNRSDNAIYGGAISGSGSMTKQAAGTLILTGNNTYTGVTAIDAGTLQVGDGGTSGSIAGNVTNSSALVFNRSDTLNYAGTITGTGSLTQAGTGMTTLTGTGSSVASADVIAGTLNLAQSGAFTTTGNYTTGANATTQLATNATLSVGGILTQAANSTINVALGSTQPAISATTANLAGTLNITGYSATAPGSASGLTGTQFNVIHTTGGITNNFTSVNVGGSTSPVDYLDLTAAKSANGLDYNIGLQLTWLAGATQANGVFTLANSTDAFNVDVALSDQAASSVPWNGTTLTKNGAGTLTLSAANTYTGGTVINAGTLQLGSGGTSGSIVGDVLDNGSLSFNRSDTSTFSGVVSGTGSLAQSGSGTTILTGSHTYTGGTSINAGTLQIGDGGTAGSIVGDVTDNGALAFNRSDSVTFGGVVSGAGSLTQAGTGTTILTSNNAYAGGTTISAGTLQLGSGGTAGSIVGNVTDNAALVFNRSDIVTFGNAISGTGTLTQAGSGTLILAGNNTYGGGTTVASGRLNVTGSIAGNAQVSSGATLGGTGSIVGTAALASGAHLAPGDSPGTLTVGSLVLDAGSQLDYELGIPNVVGGGTNDLTNVTGNLTLAGTLNVTDAGGFSSGVYRLINYGGTLSNSGLAIGTQPIGFTPDDFLVQTSQANQINLIVEAGGFANQFWDGPQTTGNGVIAGGTGTWNTTTTNWTGVDGSTNAPWQSGFAIFEGAAGTVTLGQHIAFSGMQFLTDGYVIEGGGFTLAGTPTTTIRTDPGVTAILNAPLVDGTGGAATLVKRDAGTLILTAANTYSGGTTIDAGTLQW